MLKLGGPSWQLNLGRRDAITASQAAANSSIPAPTSSLSQLITSFANLGFTAREMVALSGPFHFSPFKPIFYYICNYYLFTLLITNKRLILDYNFKNIDY